MSLGGNQPPGGMGVYMPIGVPPWTQSPIAVSLSPLSVSSLWIRTYLHSEASWCLSQSVGESPRAAPTLALAKKLLRSGGDALVIEGMEAGGHIGPVSTSVLAQEFLPELAEDHLVFVAGGIGRGWVDPGTRPG